MHGWIFFPINDFSLRESCPLYLITNYKTSNCCKTEAIIQRCSVKKVFLKHLWNSNEKLCARVSFLIKLQLKKRLLHMCFPLNIGKLGKFLRTLFFLVHLRWLPLVKLEISKISAAAIFDDTWYHGLPQHCNIIVVKRNIRRKIVVSVHIPIQTLKH